MLQTSEADVPRNRCSHRVRRLRSQIATPVTDSIATGGWPSGDIFANLAAMVTGVRSMAHMVGIDMLGFISPPVFEAARG